MKKRKTIVPSNAYPEFTVDTSKPFVLPVKKSFTLNIESMQEPAALDMPFIEELDLLFNQFIDQADGSIRKNIYETVKTDFMLFLNPTTDPNQTDLFNEDNSQ